MRIVCELNADSKNPVLCCCQYRLLN